MKYFFITLVSLFVLISCDNATKYKAEISKIDNFKNKLDSIELALNLIQVDSLIYMQKTAKQNEAVIKKYYTADTVNMNFAQKMDMNKGIRKSFLGVDKQKSSLLKELNAIKTQFSNLKTDILEGLYNSDQIKDYLNVEQLDFESLNTNFNSFSENIKQKKRNFYYANPQINSYCEELLNSIEK